MFIKICGITQPEQAYNISRYGATHIGVVFFEKSPRHVSLEEIRHIKEAVSDSTKLVAVVVNPTKEIVNSLFEFVDMVQFHGDEPLEFISQFPKEKVIKAFRLKDEKVFNEIEKFLKNDYLILVDSYSKGAYGGTGKQINKDFLYKLKRITDRFILSGGLSETNVGKLIDEIKPYGVDASSKLEVSPGIKDLEKVKKFIKIAKDKLGDT